MEIKVMTFNLRVDVAADGINYFPNREHRVLETILTEKPDLIGFQEAANYARAYLKSKLSEDYVIVGCGRNELYRGESCMIAFRKDRFELVNFSTRFLSTTPNVPGSRYAESDQSSCPRTYVHAELSMNDRPGLIHFYNTHLDHKGEQARFLGMTQILGDLTEAQGPVILTGDMNARPDQPCMRMPLTVGSRPLKEATADIHHTFHNFGKIGSDTPVKIDYIFTDAEVVNAYAVADDPADGVYISDHFPVCAILDL